MHFSKIYIQKNFVPDIVTDPFGREVIGTEVTIEDGEDIERARFLAKQYIEEYIKDNTVIPHNHIEEKYIPEDQLPSIQVDKPELREMTLEEQIRSSEDLKVLASYKFIAKNGVDLQKAFDERYDELTNLKIKQLQP